RDGGESRQHLYRLKRIPDREVVVVVGLQAMSLTEKVSDLGRGDAEVLGLPHLDRDCPHRAGATDPDPAEQSLARRRQGHHHNVVLVLAPRVLALAVEQAHDYTG